MSHAWRTDRRAPGPGDRSLVMRRQKTTRPCTAPALMSALPDGTGKGLTLPAGTPSSSVRRAFRISGLPARSFSRETPVAQPSEGCLCGRAALMTCSAG
jgi:hypothetical protein